MAERRALDIAFFVDAFPDLAVTFIIDQVAGLLERGHRVQVFAQRPGRTDREHPDVTRFELRSRTTYIGPDTNPVRRIARAVWFALSQPHRFTTLMRTLPPWSDDPLARSLRSYFAAAHIRGRLHFDVVHCHFGPNGNLAAELEAAQLLSGGIVTTFHGYDMRIAERSSGEVYAPLRARGSRFLSISGYNRRLLEDWGFEPERIVEHHVGISPDQFVYRGRRQDAGNEICVLSVANLVPVKGHTFLLHGVRRLLDARPHLRLRLRLVGEGPERSKLEALISELRLESVVTLLGGLPRNAVRDELQAADLFVLPSLAEATPVALMEAQAVGLPVVATRVGAVEEVVVDGRSGLVVEPGDAEALSSALGELVDRRDDWDAMGRAGRDHVLAHYSLPVLLDELEAIYLDVLSERPESTRANARASMRSRAVS